MANDPKTLFPTNAPMKPMMILPRGEISKADIARLNQNGLCVVEAKDPAKVRFVDALPAVSARGAIESAAIALSRKVLNPGFWQNNDTRKTMAETFLDLLVKGSPLDPEPSQEERERAVYNEARIDELRRIAREEARAEKAARDAEAAEAAKAAAAAKAAKDAAGPGPRKPA